MENAQKAIMIGVGLFITIIIIAAVMLITGLGQNLLNQGQAQVSGISESLMNDLYEQYNGKVMTGSQVRTAAIQLLNRDAGITVKIAAAKRADVTTANFEQTSGNASTDYTDLVNKALKGKDSVKFTGNVTRNTTTGVVTIEFN